MMLRLTAATAAALLVWSGRVEGYGPKTESMKKQERFFMCILAIEEADTDRDDMLSRYEYQPFVQALSTSMFEEQVIEDGELPRELAKLYPHLVQASEGNLVGKGNKNIDVFGARMDEMNEASSQRLNALHTVCEMTMKELSMLGPQTDAPVLMMDAMETEEEFEKGDDPDEPKEPEATGFGVSEQMKSQGDLDFEYEMKALNTEMISVHSSFIIANMHSIHYRQVDLSHGGLLHMAYVKFINDLMDHLCHSGVPCPDDSYHLQQSEEEYRKKVNEWKTKGRPNANANFKPKAGSHEHSGKNADPEREEEAREEAAAAKAQRQDEEDDGHRSLLFFPDLQQEALQQHRMLCRGDKPSQSACAADSFETFGNDGQRRRSLIQAASLEDAELYEVKEFDCPMEIRKFSVEHYHGLLPQCATVYGHYDVLVTHMHQDIQHVEQNYVTATSAAILRGKLQEALMKVDRHNQNKFEVLGPGQYRYPHQNTHHVAGEANTKHGEDYRNGWDRNHPAAIVGKHPTLHVGHDSNPEQEEEKIYAKQEKLTAEEEHRRKKQAKRDADALRKKQQQEQDQAAQQEKANFEEHEPEEEEEPAAEVQQPEEEVPQEQPPQEEAAAEEETAPEVAAAAAAPEEPHEETLEEHRAKKAAKRAADLLKKQQAEQAKAAAEAPHQEEEAPAEAEETETETTEEVPEEEEQPQEEEEEAAPAEQEQVQDEEPQEEVAAAPEEVVAAPAPEEPHEETLEEHRAKKQAKRAADLLKKQQAEAEAAAAAAAASGNTEEEEPAEEEEEDPDHKKGTGAHLGKNRGHPKYAQNIVLGKNKKRGGNLRH